MQRQFKCGIADCTYVGTTRQIVERHRTLNHKPGAIKCEICSEYVSNQSALNKHNWRNHKETIGPGRGRNSAKAKATRAQAKARPKAEPKAKPKPKPKAKTKAKAKAKS